MLAFDETVQTTGIAAGQWLDVTERVSSGNRRYAPGRSLQSYEERRTSPATGDVETKVKWTADKLDNQGRAIETQETQTTGAHVTTANRKNIAYDVFGRLAAYEEQATDSARADVSVANRWAGEYDNQSRLATFNENHHETSLGYHLTTTLSLIHI